MTPTPAKTDGERGGRQIELWMSNDDCVESDSRAIRHRLETRTLKGDNIKGFVVVK